MACETTTVQAAVVYQNAEILLYSIEQIYLCACLSARSLESVSHIQRGCKPWVTTQVLATRHCTNCCSAL